jgi:hypothetical protein
LSTRHEYPEGNIAAGKWAREVNPKLPEAKRLAGIGTCVSPSSILEDVPFLTA